MDWTTARPSPVPSPSPGGEERVEDAVPDLRRDTGSGVAYPQAQIGSGLQLLQFGAPLRPAEGYLRKTQGQLAASLHGVQGIGAQVHEHLVELGGIGQHRALGSGDARGDGNGRRKGGAQHLDHFADDTLRFERLEALGGVVAEAEDLAHQVAGAQAGLLDLVEVAPHARVGVADVHERHGRVAEDHREDVVEVVGHAAGEQADHLHLLHLAEFVLGLAPAGVVKGDLQAHHAAVDPAHRVVIVAVPAVGHRVVVFPLADRAGLALLVEQPARRAEFARALTVLEHPVTGLAGRLVTELLAHLAVDKEDLATGQVTHADGGLDAVEDGEQLLVRRGPLPVDVSAGGAVQGNPVDAQLPRGRAPDSAPLEDGPLAPVGVREPVLDLVGLVLGHGPLHRGHHPLLILRVDEVNQAAGRCTGEFGRGAPGQLHAALTDKGEGARSVARCTEDHAGQVVDERVQLTVRLALLRLDPLMVSRDRGRKGLVQTVAPHCVGLPVSRLHRLSSRPAGSTGRRLPH